MKADHKAAQKLSSAISNARHQVASEYVNLAAAYLERDTQLKQANQLNETLTRDLVEMQELAKAAMKNRLVTNKADEALRAVLWEEQETGTDGFGFPPLSPLEKRSKK